MLHRVFSIAGCLCVLLTFAPVAQDAAVPAYASPESIVLDKDGKTLYVAEFTANQIAVIDTASAAVAKTIAVPERPGGIALAPDGAHLYVTGGQPAGKVFEIDLASGQVTRTIPVGHTPVAPVVSPDGKTLYVCNWFNNNVSVVDLTAGAEAGKIAVVREPVAAALTPDGKKLVVANHLPAGPSDGDFTAAAVSIIDTASKQVGATVPLQNGCSSLRGVCISPDGKFAYVTHILGRYQLPTTQLERGWMNTNALSIIDLDAQKLLNTVLLDDVDLGAANPCGVACTADGKFVCVAHAGTHEISVIDRAALHDKLAKVAAGESVSDVSKTPADVPNDLSFLVGLRRRLALAGNGPRGIALAGTKLFAAEYFTDSIGMLDVAPCEYPAKAKSLPLGEKKPMTAERKGEMFFNDAALCFQHWQSCASCHPESRADGLNWDLLNDGIGNPKNTKSMLLSHQTPPVMSLGVRDTAETAVRSGIKYILFAVRPEEEAAAIDSYLKSMKPVPSPYAGEAANRGKAVFEKAGCAECHPAPLYTSLKTYNVGTGNEREHNFDTPTLVEVWRTAPYLHDGSAATIEDLLTISNPGDKHGETSKLSKEDLSDLVAFVLSL